MEKKIILPVFAILSIALILVGTTYAYWRFTYISDKTNIGKSKCLSIELTNQKNEISLNNTYPISDLEAKKLTPYSFTINNTCDTFISYDVNLEMLEGTTMNSKYMVVMINNEHKELLSNLDNANTVMSSSVESRKLVSGSLGVGDSVDYTLRLWIDESVTLSDDAQNKTFTSKIVVNAQPSNYNPKDAGYDTLHDAILANEYQTTPEKAIEKIKAKGEPDLSRTAPIIKWKENISNGITTLEVTKFASESINSDKKTSLLAKNDYLVNVSSNLTFNEDNGEFYLDNFVNIDPTSLDFEKKDYYIINEEITTRDVDGYTYYWNYHSTSDKFVYKIISVEKENVTVYSNYSGIKYIFSVKKMTSYENEIDKSDKGLYQSTDDYGTTYYYRGNINNNNVYFAGFYWQIIRINGDNTIRLMFNGTGNKNNELDKFIGKTSYNNDRNSPAYGGYMYGNNVDSRENSLKNEINSTLKSFIDKWYSNNIVNRSYEKYISDSGFCNDRSLFSGDGYSTNSVTIFGSYTSEKVSYICKNKESDLFTTVTANIGNKSLNYPIGTITYDELIFAGNKDTIKNKFAWTYSNYSYLTMSPSRYDPSYSTQDVWTLTPTYLQAWQPVTYESYVKPVISLKADVKISGGIGTANDPFIIDINN